MMLMQADNTPKVGIFAGVLIAAIVNSVDTNPETLETTGPKPTGNQCVLSDS